MKIISFFISKIRKEQFVLDSSIPLAYILSLLFSKTVAFVWGHIYIKKISKVFFIHYSAIIKAKSFLYFGNGMNIDRNCYIDALSVNGVTFGNNVSLGKNTTIECTGTLKNIGKGLIVGNRVGLGSHGFLGCAGGIEIGDDTILGNFVTMHSENHIFDSIDFPIRLQGVSRKGIKIGSNCWLGAKVTILDGSEIGDGCVIAAGAVVRGQFPPNCVIGGIPAKVIKYRGVNNE